MKTLEQIQTKLLEVSEELNFETEEYNKFAIEYTKNRSQNDMNWRLENEARLARLANLKTIVSSFTWVLSDNDMVIPGYNMQTK